MVPIRTAVLAASTLALALAMTSCSSGTESSSGGQNSNGTLTLGSVVLPSSYAADAAVWGNQSVYEQAVYDTLVRETPDLKIEPSLATSWSYNADKTVLTMKLRTDVKFSDGTAFNADAAAQNLTRFKNGTSSLRNYLSQMTKAEAVDAATLRITLSEPNPALLQYLSQAAGLQQSPKSFDAPDEATNPVGSGPYILDTSKTVVGSKYVYKKNPDYWAPQDQHYNDLVINVYQTTPTQVNAVRGGQVNGLALIDNSAVDQLKSAGYDIENWELNVVGLLLLDRDGKLTPAMKDVRVRQAINYAIDRDAMLKGAGQGMGTTTTQFFKPSDTASYDKSLDSKYPYDPDKAKQLLQEAGYGNGFSVTMPQLATGSTAQYDLVKQYLGDVGINVKFVNEPANNFLADVSGAKFSAVSALPLQADPTAWQVANFKLLPDATWNPFHTADPEVESLAKTIQTGSSTEAAAASKELNRYIVDQAWFAPWYRPLQSFVVDSNTKVTPQQDNAYPYLWNIEPKS
ncbi:ABC transporter substrate-binding protein [Streptomyces blattellae]|uniref:ABC transporter substrate-binding protein n=1 Tax=Streptomyces blattellae TaxID=2569855 RepID=UPI001E3F23AD|nr:ABC transporter substrate-binding protein [Streptomyces blattellae]